MIEIIKGVPLWVWAVLLYVVWRGVKASETRVVPWKRLFILPAVLVFLSLHSVVGSLNGGALLFWGVGVVVGVPVGLQWARGLNVRVDREAQLIELPGSWALLVWLLVLFACKFYFGYLEAVDPSLMTHGSLGLAKNALFGAFLGVFLGRMGGYVLLMKTKPHVTLSPSSSS